MDSTAGGGGNLLPTFSQLHFQKDLKQMIKADPSLFADNKSSLLTSAQSVVHALLASESSNLPDAPPNPLGAEGEGGSAPNPPQRDKAPKFQLGASLQEQDQLKVLAMLDNNVDRFAFSMEDLEPFKGEPMHISLNTKQAIFRPPHKLGQVEWDFVQAQCKKLEHLGMIQRSTQSLYASATVVVRKKDAEGNYTDFRQCGDYRPLNVETDLDRYPLPGIEDIFNQMGGATIFSKLDLRSGYHQMPLRTEDRCKTAFWGANRVLWEWLVVPFGLKNAPPYFQRRMDEVLRDLPFTRCYIDDIVIWSNSLAEHLQHLEVVFERLRVAGLKVHPGKCVFGVDSIDFLGHRISANSSQPQQDNLAAVRDLPSPTDLSSLRAALGLFSYYRKFVLHFSSIAFPLNALLKKDRLWEWGPEQQAAFITLKEQLCSAAVLRLPDAYRPFILTTDWSQRGMGAILSQLDLDGVEHLVCYASRSCNAAEQNYNSFDGECLAVVWASSHFRPYLFGNSFTLVTDHEPLKWLMTTQKLTGKLARWSLLLQEFDFSVTHRAGVDNLNADCLSRYPLPSTAEAPFLDWAKGDILAPTTFLAMMANIPEAPPPAAAEADIWEDLEVLRLLQTHKYGQGLSAQERDRTYRRAKNYRWMGNNVYKMQPRGVLVVVPKPAERAAIVLDLHRSMGHFGVQRVLDRLQKDYWWRNMGDAVVAAVKSCLPCARVKAGFRESGKELQPLPVRGLGYRWGVDFAGPLPKTSAGNSWVMVCIEHFTKWIELIPLPSKSSKDSARGLLEGVLSRYGAPGEILTDQGREFIGEFQTLLNQHEITHRLSSREHPQSDGLAERMVQTMKRSLRKCLLDGGGKDWDELLPYIAMGYRMSKQKSVGYSPYFLMFGRDPILQSRLQHLQGAELDLDISEERLQIFLNERGQAFKRVMPLAMRNLAIAQQRDKERYRLVRGGGWDRPKASFMPGDYVLLKQQTVNTLDAPTRSHVLRVVEIKPTGVALLEGSDAARVEEQQKNIAHCPLPILDTNLYPERFYRGPSLHCRVCGTRKKPSKMVVCDACNQGYHLWCLDQPLLQVPDGIWKCPRHSGTQYIYIPSC